MSQPSPITVWATTANYPAGSDPWSAQVTKTAPGYTYATPGVPVDADHFNYLMNLRDIYANAINAWAGVTFATNTITNVANLAAGPWVVNGGSGVKPTWDGYLARWLLAALNVSPAAASSVQAAMDGLTFSSIHSDALGSGVLTFPVAVRPSDGNYVYFDVNQWFYSGTSGTESPSGATANCASAAFAAQFWGGGKYYFIGFHTSGTSQINGTAFYNTAGTSGGWTALTVPAAWSSMASTTIPVCMSAVLATYPIFGTPDSLFGFGNCSAGSGLGYLSAAAGTTLTDVTPTVLVSNPTYDLRGIAYDGVSGKSIIAVAGGGGVTLYSTTTPQTTSSWVASSGAFFSNLYCAGIACAGGVWAIALNHCPIFEVSSGGSKCGVFLSTDQGATWFPALGFYGASQGATITGGATSPIQSISSNGSQFLIVMTGTSGTYTVASPLVGNPPLFASANL